MSWQKNRSALVLAPIVLGLLLLALYSQWKSTDPPRHTAPPSATSIPTRTPPTATLSPNVLIRNADIADGYDWSSATVDDKKELIQWMNNNERAALGSAPDWMCVYTGVAEFYRNGSELIMTQKIGEVAATISLSCR